MIHGVLHSDEIKRYFHKFLIFGSIVSAVFLWGCGGGEPPKELTQGRIVLEKQRYKKELFFEDLNLSANEAIPNLIYDLRRGNFDNDSDEEILVVGSYGAYLLTIEGKLKKSISFGIRSLYDIHVVDIDNDDKYEFLGGSLRKPSVALFDNQGKTFWTYTTSSTTGYPVAGDINGDGMKEIIFPYLQGLYVFDAKGNLLKDFKKGNIYISHIEVGDFNGDGKCEILYSDEQKDKLMVQEETGNILSCIEPQLLNYTFSITDWLKESPSHILLVGSEKMQILDIKGKPIVTLNTPYSSYSCRRPLGVLLRITQDNTNPYGYLSSIRGRGGWHRTVIYVNSLSGELLYQEIIEEDCESLLAFNDSASKPGWFLVGGRNQVWRYTPL